ncbi:MAG TPA: cation diffusion facilitator family transporter, partial [Gemmatimonadaceae bacterium]|nr:cation diffusion facilitator family transporter [Gemmatimonadaceae bacterium]
RAKSLVVDGMDCNVPVFFDMSSRSHSGHSHGGGHDHAHDHAHGHALGHAGHSHAPASFGRAFAIGIGLNVTFVLVEAFFGFRANSVALLADAGHNLGDVLGLAIAWGASVLATADPTPRRTYGLRSTSILAALVNAVILLIAVGGIAWEAIGRVGRPEPVVAGTMIWVAAAGIVINGATALLFMSGRSADLNLRGAYLHMAADAGVSAGVVIAGLVIAAKNWLWLDPVISIVIALLIAIGTWGLLRDSVNLALDAVPAHVDPGAVQAYLRELPGVTGVHDLHIWGMSTTDVALTAHIIRPQACDDDTLLVDAARVLHERFGISHPTLQVERGNGPHDCRLAPADVI